MTFRLKPLLLLFLFLPPSSMRLLVKSLRKSTNFRLTVLSVMLALMRAMLVPKLPVNRRCDIFIMRRISGTQIILFYSFTEGGRGSRQEEVIVFLISPSLLSTCSLVHAYVTPLVTSVWMTTIFMLQSCFALRPFDDFCY